MTSIPSWARVGAKVVCVDDRCEPPVWGGWPICTGAIYEIERVFRYPANLPFRGPFRGATVAVVLLGVPNPSGPDGAFALARFRPVVSPEQDVALFTHLLNPTRVPEVVE